MNAEPFIPLIVAEHLLAELPERVSRALANRLDVPTLARVRVEQGREAFERAWAAAVEEIAAEVQLDFFADAHRYTVAGSA